MTNERKNMPNTYDDAESVEFLKRILPNLRSLHDDTKFSSVTTFPEEGPKVTVLLEVFEPNKPKYSIKAVYDSDVETPMPRNVRVVYWREGN